MNVFKRVLLGAALLATAARAQDVPPVPTPVPTPPPVATITTQPGILLGSGIGFKPYQTSIKAGSSAYISAGTSLTSGQGIYGFARVELRPTDAQLIIEGCKRISGKDSNALILLCGGPGFGADASNIGLSLAAGGKLFYNVSKRAHIDNTFLSFELSVDKQTVPAPVSTLGTVNPVQPAFRFGIFKEF